MNVCDITTIGKDFGVIFYGIVHRRTRTNSTPN